MVAVAMSESVNSYVIETELYRCVIDMSESVISIKTEYGPEAARRFAEFEAERAELSISLIFGLDGDKTYLYRLKSQVCLDGELNEDAGDRYKDHTGRHSPGCPHSRRGSPKTCSMCIAAAEKAELIALIKAGKL